MFYLRARATVQYRVEAGVPLGRKEMESVLGMQYRSEPGSSLGRDEMDLAAGVPDRHLDGVRGLCFTRQGARFELADYPYAVGEREINRMGIYIRRINGPGDIMVDASIDASKLAEPATYEYAG